MEPSCFSYIQSRMPWGYFIPYYRLPSCMHAQLIHVHRTCIYPYSIYARQACMCACMQRYYAIVLDLASGVDRWQGCGRMEFHNHRHQSTKMMHQFTQKSDHLLLCVMRSSLQLGYMQSFPLGYNNTIIIHNIILLHVISCFNSKCLEYSKILW